MKNIFLFLLSSSNYYYNYYYINAKLNKTKWKKLTKKETLLYFSDKKERDRDIERKNVRKRDALWYDKIRYGEDKYPNPIVNFDDAQITCCTLVRGRGERERERERARAEE